MSRKRFTDADKWEDPWFCEQDTEVKLFWLYLCDRCDHAGVWQVNWKLARFHLGEADPIRLKQALAGRVQEIDQGRKWFIPGFITFQYPTGLSLTSPAHKRIRSTIESHGLDPDRVCDRVVTRVQSTPEDKEEDKDKDQEEDRDSKRPFQLQPAIPPVIDPTEQDITSGPARTKPPGAKPLMGVMHLHGIPSIIKRSEDEATWLACLNEVGEAILKQAAMQIARTGEKGWASVVCPLAYSMKAGAIKPTLADQPPQEVLPEDLTTLPITHLMNPNNPASPLYRPPRKTIPFPTHVPGEATKP